MAEACAESMIPDHDFQSAGIFAQEGAPMSANAEAALSFYNIPYREHRARPLTAESIDKADLILTMSGGHKRMLEASAENKVFTLREYTLGDLGDIADPFGGDEDTYIKCLEEIIECINALKEKLK